VKELTEVMEAIGQLTKDIETLENSRSKQYNLSPDIRAMYKDVYSGDNHILAINKKILHLRNARHSLLWVAGLVDSYK
jgi:hypothetical protein